MRKKNLRVIIPFVTMILFLVFLSVFSLNSDSSLNEKLSLSPQITIPAPLVVPATLPCTNVAPVIPITTTLKLCGIINLRVPIVITANNVNVYCNPNTILRPTLPIGLGIDAFQIAPGVRGVTITGCSVEGRFGNAVRVGAGANGNLIQSNTFRGMVGTGIFEEQGAFNNVYSAISISKINTGLKLEGNRSTVEYSNIANTAIGIQTGINSINVNSATPNAVCSPSSTICSLPSSGREVRIRNNELRNNNIGVEVYGLDNRIESNNILDNVIGVRANTIYVGSSPSYWGNFLQHHVNSGIGIFGNNIRKNIDSGIVLNGASTYYWSFSSYANAFSFARMTGIMGNELYGNGKGIEITFDISLSNQLSPQYINWGGNYWTDPLFSIRLTGWNENTLISNNVITRNNEGIFAESGGSSTDVIYNSINLNANNGVLTSTFGWSLSPAGGKSSSGLRFLYDNEIMDNGADGLSILGSFGPWYTELNKINRNSLHGIYSTPFSFNGGAASNSLNLVLCNDISNNILEGINYNVPNLIGYPQVLEVSYNRIHSNGADGIKYFVDMMVLLNFPDAFVWRYGSKTINNDLRYNAGYGINVDGMSYHGFFRNNFVANVLGIAMDTSSRGGENMWDEQQYELGFDNVACRNCGQPCVTDYDCGWFGGTCVNNICQAPPGSGLSCNPVTGNVDCYANLYNNPATYVPRGNFGLPSLVPTGTTLLPLPCAIHQDCITNSCELYPSPVNGLQCGNGDKISSSTEFGGYYTEDLICPTVFYYPLQVYVPYPPPIISGGENSVGLSPPTDDSTLQYGNFPAFSAKPFDESKMLFSDEELKPFLEMFPEEMRDSDYLRGLAMAYADVERRRKEDGKI